MLITIDKYYELDMMDDYIDYGLIWFINRTFYFIDDYELVMMIHVSTAVAMRMIDEDHDSWQLPSNDR